MRNIFSSACVFVIVMLIFSTATFGQTCSGIQRLSGTPLIKMALPLSARIIPYFLRALKITWSPAG